jgi:hypothetical protein
VKVTTGLAGRVLVVELENGSALVALGIAEAQKAFRRVKGYVHMPSLIAAIRPTATVVSAKRVASEFQPASLLPEVTGDVAFPFWLLVRVGNIKCLAIRSGEVARCSRTHQDSIDAAYRDWPNGVTVRYIKRTDGHGKCVHSA